MTTAQSKFEVKTCKTCGQFYDRPSTIFKLSKKFRFHDGGHLWVNCNCGSTLMWRRALSQPWMKDGSFLPKGDPQKFWSMLSQPEIFPLLNADVFVDIEDIDKCVDRIDLIVNKVSKKPLLAASVINFANSIAKTRGGMITGINHAISYVGWQSIKKLILSIAARQELQKMNFHWLDQDKFWKKAALSAEISLWLADYFLLSDEASSDLYLGVQLMNVGKIIQARIYPAKSQEIYRQSSIMAISFLRAEQEMGIIPHVSLSEIALSLWGMSDRIIDIAGRHHNEPHRDVEPGRSVQLWELAAFANQLSHWVNLESEQVYEGYLHRHRARLGISEVELNKLIDHFVSLQKRSA